MSASYYASDVRPHVDKFGNVGNDRCIDMKVDGRPATRGFAEQGRKTISGRRITFMIRKLSLAALCCWLGAAIGSVRAQNAETGFDRGPQSHGRRRHRRARASRIRA